MRAGRIGILAAGAAILLIAPFLIDYVQWSLWRQRLQQQADGAALEAAAAIDRGELPGAAVGRRLAGVALAAPAHVEAPPSDGRYAGRPDAVRVALTARRSTFFHGRLFGASRMNVRASAARVEYRGGGSSIVRVE